MGEWGDAPILTFPPRGKGYSATLPLWVPAFAGTTMGECGQSSADGRRVVVPLSRDGPSRASGLSDSRSAPTVGWGMRRGLVAGVLCPAHLWIPAFAGTTIAGVRAGKCCWWRRVGVPLRRDGRFSKRPYGALGEWGMRRGLVVGVPLAAPPLWIPAFAGMTWGGAGTTGRWVDRGHAHHSRGPKRRGGPLGVAAPYESPCWQCALRQAQGERVSFGLTGLLCLVTGVLCLVAVVVRLVGAFRRDAEVRRLLGGELREVGAEAA